MRDHAHVRDSVWWPSEPWLWTVDTVIICRDGSRLLAISRGETEADIVTRVVPEHEVTSNAFTRPEET